MLLERELWGCQRDSTPTCRVSLVSCVAEADTICSELIIAVEKVDEETFVMANQSLRMTMKGGRITSIVDVNLK